jgi:hypothetical protein
MTLHGAVSWLAENVLQDLAVTVPVDKKIERVWKFPPTPNKALVDVPAAIITHEMQPLTLGSALLMIPMTLHVQIVAGRVENEESAEIATALLDALITRIASTAQMVTLGGNVTVVNTIRGGQAVDTDTLVRLGWGKQQYVGLDLFIDVTMNQQPGYA